MTRFEKLKISASVAGVIIGTIGCILFPCGLLSDNGPAALAGGLMLLTGFVSAFID